MVLGVLIKLGDYNELWLLSLLENATGLFGWTLFGDCGQWTRYVDLVYLALSGS